tara:strand:+ start:70654 stop:71589 length:936 start_codon:yes stop_codon:yes gene_type:complete
LKLNDLKNAWNNYFFQEKPVDGICILRIFFGLLVFSTFFQDAIFYKDIWSTSAIQTLEISLRNYSFPILNIFQYLPNEDWVVKLSIIIMFIALFSFILGLKTKTSALICFILLVSFNQRNINMLSSADLLIRIILMYFVFAPSGNKYSLDAYFARKKGRELASMASPWIHRILQIQIAVVYVSTVIAKSKGHTWVDGSAVYYATRLTDFERFPVPIFLDYMWSIKLMTWSTLVLEFALGSLIFIDELRKPLIILGIFFHLGIEYMMAIPTFEWLMIVCLIGMFKIEEYPVIINKIKERFIFYKFGNETSNN